MEVKATQRGYHGLVLVEPGTKFNVPDGSVASWFVPVKRNQEVVESDDSIIADGPSDAELDKFNFKKKSR